MPMAMILMATSSRSAKACSPLSFNLLPGIPTFIAMQLTSEKFSRTYLTITGGESITTVANPSFTAFTLTATSEFLSAAVRR